MDHVVGTAIVFGIVAGLVSMGILLLYIRFVDRKTERHATPGSSTLPPADNETEEELQMLLVAAGVSITPEEVSALSNREYSEAWEYVRALAESRDSWTIEPMPQCLRRRGRAIS